MNGSRRESVPEPRAVWADRVARRLRTSVVMSHAYRVLARRLVPLLFAVFVAVPVGLLILVFFIPKFVRNARRRRKYGVRLERGRIDRIAGETRMRPREGDGDASRR
jgi:hypothetical protein